MSDFDAVLAALHDADLLVERPTGIPRITQLTDDSRRAREGSLFCAIRGTGADGHAYVDDAVARGATAVMVTRRLPLDVPQVVVRDDRAAVSVAAAAWFGYPARTLEVIGVTGTNGKSTTVHIARHLLNAEGDVGALGTLGGIDPRGTALPDQAGLTTPGAIDLQAALAALRERGARRVVMEVSSHALDQRRVDQVRFRAAVFTNLTRDHLDYHSDLDRYRAAKARLADLLADDGVLVLNADVDDWATLPQRTGARTVSFGAAGPATVRADAMTCTMQGSEWSVRFGADAYRARLPLLGSFNVHNALAAAAVAWAFDVPPDVIVTRLATVPQVPGRMERLVDRPFTVLRDYAHTPDALERALTALRPLTTGQLVVLFGAGGDRDRGKRPLMGAVAARLADIAVVTSDNPRTEDPERIVDEIEAGMMGADHLRVVDRNEAIREALALLRPGDCLLLAGKGHETYQIVGTEKRPFDERALVHEALGLSAA